MKRKVRKTARLGADRWSPMSIRRTDMCKNFIKGKDWECNFLHKFLILISSYCDGFLVDDITGTHRVCTLRRHSVAERGDVESRLVRELSSLYRIVETTLSKTLFRRLQYVRPWSSQRLSYRSVTSVSCEDRSTRLIRVNTDAITTWWRPTSWWITSPRHEGYIRNDTKSRRGFE